MMRLLLLLAASALFLLPRPVAAQPAEADVPVRRIVLYKSGVGYFEHRGAVQGRQTVTLRFAPEQINDVLKSLVVQDTGGQVEAVRYPSQDPLARRLGSYAVDLSGTPSLLALLNQVRGSAVVIETTDPTGTLNGIVVSVEERRVRHEGAVIESGMLTLFSGGTLRAVPLPRIRRITLSDEQLRRELEAALEALDAELGRDLKAVQITFDGSARRPVRLGYVVEAPVWKTSYRLLLPEGAEGRADLQGWAIVENQTDLDWTDVQLALVSGRPISFVMDLYAPRYAERPVVEPQTFEHLAPQRYEAGLEAAPPPPAQDRRMQEAKGVGAARASDEPLDMTEGVAEAATAGTVGEVFRYDLGAVSLPRQRSAMVPIVTRPVEAERVSIYNRSVIEGRPLRGARFTNTTDLHLAPGPVTVLDAGTYAGDALLAYTPPGEEGLLSYAIDLDMRVIADRTSDATVTETASISDGVLTIRRERIITRTYTVENNAPQARTLLIEHPRTPGASLRDTPEPVSRTAELYRFRLTLAPDETETFTVTEARPLEERIALVQFDADWLRVLARDGELPADVRRALLRAVGLQEDVAAARRAVEQVERALEDLRREQERIRQNMEVVDSETDYYQQLLDKLEAQESQIEDLQEELDEHRAEREEAQERLRDYLRNLRAG